MTPSRIAFGPFQFDPGSGNLRKDGCTITLQQQPARVLALLTARPGELVTRDQMRREIWGDTWVNFDQGLNYCIRQIRIALEDDVRAPRYVQTLPQRGYRFVAGVSNVPDTTASAPRRFQHPLRIALAASLLLAVGAFAGLQAAAVMLREVAPGSEVSALAEHFAPAHFVRGTWTHHIAPLISTPPRP